MSLLPQELTNILGVPQYVLDSFVEATVKSDFELKDTKPCLQYSKHLNTACVKNTDATFTKTEIVRFEALVDSLSPPNQKTSKCDLLLTKSNCNSIVVFLELSESKEKYAQGDKYATAQKQLRASIALVATTGGQVLQQYKQKQAIYAYRVTDGAKHPMRNLSAVWVKSTRPNIITLQADFGNGFEFKAVRYPAQILI